MSFARFATPFAVFQTVFELLEIARASTQATRARILDQMPVAASLADFDSLIDDQRGVLSESQVETLYPPLLLAAVLPNDDYDAFIASSAILLADRLQDGGGSDPLDDHWDAISAHYDAAPRPVAAALRRGFALCNALGRNALRAVPEAPAMASLDKPQVLAGLRGLARTILPEDLHLMASNDGAGNFRPNRDGLKALLRSDTCLLSQDNRHVPGEVIDIASHSPGAGFAQATALSLIEAITFGDPYGHAARCWSTVARHYWILLSDAQRGPILYGYRHLWESHPSWTPYDGWSAERIARQGLTFPMAADANAVHLRGRSA